MEENKNIANDVSKQNTAEIPIVSGNHAASGHETAKKCVLVQGEFADKKIARVACVSDDETMLNDTLSKEQYADRKAKIAKRPKKVDVVQVTTNEDEKYEIATTIHEDASDVMIAEAAIDSFTMAVARMSRKWLYILIACICVALAAAGCGIGYALTASNEPEPEEVVVVNEVEEEDENTIVAVDHVSIKVNCEGWDAETSTPIVVNVYDDDVYDALVNPAEGEEVPEAASVIEVAAGEETELESIAEDGDYTVAIAGSPVLADGTIFEVPEPVVIDFATSIDTAELGDDVDYESLVEVTTKIELLPLETDENGEETDDYYQLVTITLTAKEAEDVTEEDIAAAESAAESVGADTETITQNTNAATSSAESAQGGSVKSSNTSSNSGSSSSGGSSSSSSSGSSSSGSSSSGSSSGSGSSVSSHTHSWVAITEQKWVQDTAAYDEQVYVGEQYVCSGCGTYFSTLSGINGHTENAALSGNKSCRGYSVKKVYETVHHDATGHYETVTTGYKCSTCGATK